MTDVNEPISEQSDTDIIAGDPNLIHLDGADVDVYIEQLRTRQLFKFLKILTVGAGAALADLQISADTDQAELTQQLMAIIIISLPEAEDEVIDFIHSMLKPVGIIDPERSKTDRQINVEKCTELYNDLNNPLPQDTIAIITRVIQNEAPNLIALGKQIAALIPSAAKPTTSSKKPSTKSTRAGS